MKKPGLLLVVILSLFVVVPAGAQHRIGLVGGINLAQFSLDPEPRAGIALPNRTAFGIGGVLDLGLTKNVALRLEPMYLQKGSKVEDFGREIGKEKWSYIEAPVLFKLALGAKATRPYLVAGPTIGYLLSAKYSSATGENDIKKYFRNFDFGLAFGTGVSFPVGNNSIFLEGRYASGLSNILNVPSAPDVKLKTKGLQMVAGITFPLGAGNSVAASR